MTLPSARIVGKVVVVVLAEVEVVLGRDVVVVSVEAVTLSQNPAVFSIFSSRVKLFELA